MPRNIWTNAAAPDQEWLTAGNWTLGVPVDDDDVVLNGTAVGSVACTGGPSTATGAKLNSFTRMSQYTGDVGTSAAPLRFSTVDATSDPINPLDVTGKAIVAGPGKFYFENADGGAGDEVDFMYIDTDNQSDVIELSGKIDNLTIIKGRVTALSGAVLANVFVTYRVNPNSDAVLTLENTALMASLGMNGGRVTKTTGESLAVTVSAGKCVYGISAGQATKIIVDGGVLVWNAATILGDATVTGGVLDLSQDGREKIISRLEVFPGAVYLDGPNVTILEGGSILPLTDIIP